MEMQNPLDQLRPNHLPDPVSWWPPAIGWWLSGLLILLLITAITFFTIRYIRRTRYRRLATKTGQQLLTDFQKHGDERRFVDDCNRLLKQTALQAYPQEIVARLHGQKWQQFLVDKSGNKGFMQGPGAILGSHRYQKELTVDVNALHSLTLSWIKKHHA